MIKELLITEEALLQRISVANIHIVQKTVKNVIIENEVFLNEEPAVFLFNCLKATLLSK